MSSQQGNEKHNVHISHSQGAIVGDSNSIQQNYYVTQSQPIRQVAPPPPAKLFGRDTLASEITNLLLSNRCPSIIGLWGLPGIGIGALIRYIAHQQNVDERFADGCLWIDIPPTQNDVTTIFRRLAINLGQDPRLLMDDLSAIKDHIRAALSNKTTLLVFNDVNETNTLAELTKLAGIGKNRLLITTHNREMATTFAEHTMEVPPLSSNAADSLLRHQAQLSQAINISKLLVKTAGIPLLICAVGRHIRAKRPNRKEREIQRLIAELPNPAEQLELNTENNFFQEALLLNYNAASPLAQQAFRLLGLLSPRGITESLLKEIIKIPLNQAIEIIDELLDLNLLDVDANDTYHLLNPIYIVATKLARQAPDLDELIDLAVTYLTSWVEEASSKNKFQTLEQYADSLAHYMTHFEIILSLEKWESLNQLRKIKNRPLVIAGNFTAIQGSPFPLAIVNATFNNSYLDDVDFRGALFTDLRISHASCRQLKMANSIFRDTYVENSLLNDVDLRSILAQDIYITDSSLVDVDLQSAITRDLYINHSQMMDSSLKNVQLRDLYISHSRLSYLPFTGTQIRDIYISDSILANIDFTQVDFKSLHLSGDNNILINVQLPE